MYSDFNNTLLLIDKPVGWTSFDVVNKVRKLLKTKVGHAGTLDPLASGLLLVCTGSFCKQVGLLQGWEKEYTGTLVLGSITDSYDLETPPQPFGPYEHLTVDQIREAARHFLGVHQQLPPKYSAKYHEGKRYYQLARAGLPVVQKPQKVELKEVSVGDVQLPEVKFQLVSSKGFYVRSWVHDLGQRLGCGAYLKELRRVRVGPYHVAQAWQLSDFVNFVQDRLHDRPLLS